MSLFARAAILCAASVLLASQTAGNGVLARAPAMTGMARTADGLTVMTYNVKGLPWPIAAGRGAALAQIGRQLRQMRLDGTAPDIVVLQEAFTDDARAMIAATGYRHVALGAGADAAPDAPVTPADRAFAADARWSAGETEGKVLGSGLAILSDLPIRDVRRLSFPAFDCAGYDCLAAKGAMIAAVQLPGGRGAVDIVTAHLNSRGASGVDIARADAAWDRQLGRLGAFIAAAHDPNRPMIVSGDMNVGPVLPRRTRFDAAAQRWDDGEPGRDALREIAPTGRLNADAQWSLMRARDWQIHYDGTRIGLAAQAIATPFGRDAEGDMLSDHVGYAATYRIESLR
ncbi:hypothetical protein GCM10011380_17280 [Sphingomonas metalli]|uniref:Endonuclease/exonuclease/phosphatase domain-containing protein n=1 Tax=Sphingomonas metalli TaxID=1779358 RepID=A0A916WRP3_9SPHN|nr:endonuclease/exonuclease/phosphatase family protein [Sphingomonas metalli]GGB28221.1 hypothetical protein GCM10011380_17280 [Sphingomonas metalli]